MHVVAKGAILTLTLSLTHGLLRDFCVDHTFIKNFMASTFSPSRSRTRPSLKPGVVHQKNRCWYLSEAINQINDLTIITGVRCWDRFDFKAMDGKRLEKPTSTQALG